MLLIGGLLLADWLIIMVDQWRMENKPLYAVKLKIFNIFIYVTDILTLHNPHIILNYLYLSLNKHRGFHLKFVQQNLEMFCTILIKISA